MQENTPMRDTESGRFPAGQFVDQPAKLLQQAGTVLSVLLAQGLVAMDWPYDPVSSYLRRSGKHIFQPPRWLHLRGTHQRRKPACTLLFSSNHGIASSQAEVSLTPRTPVPGLAGRASRVTVSTNWAAAQLVSASSVTPPPVSGIEEYSLE